MDDKTNEDGPSDVPTHSQAATTAGLQFVLGIGLTLAVLIPGLFIYFVLMPMGWGAIGPGIIMVLALACVAWVARIISTSNRS